MEEPQARTLRVYATGGQNLPTVPAYGLGSPHSYQLLP
jgi:hypothetical protein